MKGYAIKRPDGSSPLWNFSTTELGAWQEFFGGTSHRLLLCEAIRAYEAIGYRCVEITTRGWADDPHYVPTDGSVVAKPTTYVSASEEGKQ